MPTEAEQLGILLALVYAWIGMLLIVAADISATIVKKRREP